ncbi:ESPR domain-containing protein [Paludibacterium denitrificans]|uniref:ESPR domain-containing protein n=1 Tax=Paludibacterium denitrificans TaxID=2675226 RepID=A0A844GDM4_9NEIS|nr:ESPR domain-containing protein [Paludibacterium denitrificans]MTD32675.1 hypothetical protein [Paludibacterium denitrificans]
MNHIYRLVWSKRHEKLVAVAETTNSAGKSGSGETMNDAVSLKSGAIGGAKSLKLAASKIAAALISTGCFWGLSAFSYATPVVYFQSFTLGEQYLQNTVNSYANGGTSDFTNIALSGLSAGTSSDCW